MVQLTLSSATVEMAPEFSKESDIDDTRLLFQSRRFREPADKILRLAVLIENTSLIDKAADLGTVTPLGDNDEEDDDEQWGADA